MTSLAPSRLDDTGSDAADGVFPRRLLHEAGTLAIAAMPRRIAVISTGQLDCATTLGVVPVAATQGHGTGVFEPYLTHLHPQFARELGSLVDLGDRKAPALDVLAALKPDMIFMNLAGDRQHNHAALAEIAPVVVTRGKGINWKVDFLLMAHALGLAGRAQAFLDRFDESAAAARPRRLTLSLVQSNGRRLTIMGRQSFAGSIAEDMGLVRPEAQSFDATSRAIEKEDIGAVAADWIVYAGQGAGRDMIRSMPGWAELPAVREGRAIEVDYQPFFNNAGASAARLVLDQLSFMVRG